MTQFTHDNLRSLQRKTATGSRLVTQGRDRVAELLRRSV